MILLLARRLLLGDRGATRTFAGTGIGMRTLSANGQAATMTQPPVTTNVHEALDIQLNLLAKIALDHSLLIDQSADACQLILAQITDLLMNIDLRLTEYAGRTGSADPIDVSQTYLCAFLWR